MMDVGARIDQVLAAGGDEPAVEMDGVWHRWSDLGRLIAAVEAVLDEHGFGAPGTKIGVLLRNRPALFAAALGIIRRRGCVVTVNPMLPAGPLVEDIRRLATSVLIADPLDWDRAELVQVAAETGAFGLSVAFAADGAPAVSPVPGLAHRLEGEADLAPGIVIEMLSSGTTGTPKRIRLDRDKLSQSLWTGSKYETPDPAKLDMKPTTMVHVTPLVHIGGLWSAIYNLYNGRRLAMMDRFSAQQWRDLVVRHRPKLAGLPPSALRMVLEQDFPRQDFEGLTAIRTGTAPVDPAMVDAFWERYGVAVLDAYGATEFAGGVAGWTIKDFRARWSEKRGSVGRANHGVELRVVDQVSFAPLPAGETGLLEVRSEQISAGQNWLRTTDLAKLDEDGFLFIMGRADSAINRGGFKISPEHVQKVLALHPAIREASVVAIADARLGQVPVAALQLFENAAYPGDDAMKAFLREHLKAYEIPVAFHTVAALPRTPSMKVSQPEVRALFEPA